MKRLGALLLLFSVSNCMAETGLERMFAGFETCAFTGVYIDNGDIKPEYLKSRKPYKEENGFAWFRVADTMYGIPVVEVMIPSSTWSLHGIVFDVPLEQARAVLQKRFGRDFTQKSAEPEESEERFAQLIADRKNSARSVWVCTDPS